MAEKKANLIQLPNYGYMEYILTPEEMLPIMQEIKKIQNDNNVAIKYNDSLVGNIDKEFLLAECKNHIEKILLPLIYIYDENTHYLKTIDANLNNHPIILDSAWVNFQEKYEFNPLHKHDGVLSFVLWIKIPYTKEKELEKGPGKNISKKFSGDFCFSYTSILGNIIHQPIKLEENKLLLFPAKLNHIVYPFFSTNQTRISVSGNIKINI